MKTIGLIGGLTWHSSVDYYRYMNQLATEKRGGEHAARMILNSVDFGEIKKLTLADNWQGVADLIGQVARQTEAAGAACILLGANTMHIVADTVQSMLSVPLLHIADAVSQGVRAAGLSTVGLLGTKYTMLADFYRERLAAKGIRLLIPDTDGIAKINQSIYTELDKGIIREETRKEFQNLIGDMEEKGAQGVILGCTEIPLLIRPGDVAIPVFDSTWLHSKAAVEFALS